MLPITNQRVIHVPHSLATLAAIVALITALSWTSDPADADRTAATPDRPAPVEHAPKAPAEAGGTTARAGAGDEARSVSGLLPLVLPSVTGR